MIVVSATKIFPASLEKSWNILCDVEKYPLFVPYITDVVVSGPFVRGMVWHDMTTLLWVNLRVSHRVDHIDPKKRIVFTLPVAGGNVTEDFQLTPEEGKTRITMRISISLTPRIVEYSVGKVLAMRWQTMLTKTLINLETYLAGQGKKAGTLL